MHIDLFFLFFLFIQLKEWLSDLLHIDWYEKLLQFKVSLIFLNLWLVSSCTKSFSNYMLENRVTKCFRRTHFLTCWGSLAIKLLGEHLSFLSLKLSLIQTPNLAHPSLHFLCVHCRSLHCIQPNSSRQAVDGACERLCSTLPCWGR